MKDLIFKVSATVRNKLFWNLESSDNIVKEEKGCSSHGVIECGHEFNPFDEIVNDHISILMVIFIWGSKFHKFSSPFA